MNILAILILIEFIVITQVYFSMKALIHELVTFENKRHTGYYYTLFRKTSGWIFLSFFAFVLIIFYVMLY